MNTKHPSVDRFDVIVVGGGPAGSTAASLLSDKGWAVCVLEKDRHPRFHIGESLLPMNLPLFERLGVLDEIRKIGVRKNAAEFNALDTRRPMDTFYFGESLTGNPCHAYQVYRADLDFLLLQNARAKGATVLEGFRVIDVQLAGAPKKIQAVGPAGKTFDFECRYVIDASGRDAFLANKFNLKRKNRRHHSAAIYRHYSNAGRRDGEDAGNISIYWIEHGWIWMIPLRDNVMSIGAVCRPEYLKTRRKSLEHFLSDTLDLVPDVRERLKHASPIGTAGAAANYSYTSSRIGGDGYLLIGDAFAFIDPVFSSGVYLAMQSAESGSELVDAVLRCPGSSARRLRHFERLVQCRLRSFSWFIYRFNTRAMRALLMHHPGNGASDLFKEVKAAVISVFSGENHRHRTLWIPLLIFKFNYYSLSLAHFCERTLTRARKKIGGR